jgi:N-acyl-D-aspartate/D-glutamate deacylase
MLDYLIRSGTVIDGSGAKGVRADVGIRGGRIAAVGRISEPAAETFDADGCLVVPGFIDPHTHYDAQLFWDPAASPSNLHGVTTVIAGNCGFTLAPLAARDADYTRRMMAKVEGMPLAALEAGLPWDWSSFGEYLARLEGRIGVNAAFLVGHCALRRTVMGADSVGKTATPAQVEQMVRMLRESLAAGGLGFSTSLAFTHSDGDNQPVPSRWADREAEVLPLARAVREHEGTTLELIVDGCLKGFSDAEVDLMARMSLEAQRPLNWNVLTIDARDRERCAHQLSASRRAAERGARVVALTMPVHVAQNMSFLTYCALFLVPGWADVLNLPVPERIAKLREPATRAWMMERARSPEAGVLRGLTQWEGYTIGTTFAPANAGMEGRLLGDIARERGQTPTDALFDLVIRDELRTVLWPGNRDDSDEAWALRASTWQNPDVLLGGSDAGAHLDRMCGSPYPTQFIADCVRGRKLLPVERAVQLLTQAPAELFGLRLRGELREGWAADVAVLDPARVGAGPVQRADDLPGHSWRLISRSTGVARVLVNGQPIVEDGESTGRIPGTLLRSGRDTRTVLPA